MIDHVETPQPGTETGVKGAGEAGIIGAVAAVWCAINDALRPLGAEATVQPFTPERMLRAHAGRYRKRSTLLVFPPLLGHALAGAAPGAAATRTQSHEWVRATSKAATSFLLTVFLKHDQSKTLGEFQATLDARDWWRRFPPEGVEIVSWTVAMGLGQIVTLRLPPDRLQAVNVELERSAWGVFRTEMFVSYDFLKVRDRLARESAARREAAVRLPKTGPDGIGRLRPACRCRAGPAAATIHACRTTASPSSRGSSARRRRPDTRPVERRAGGRLRRRDPRPAGRGGGPERGRAEDTGRRNLDRSQFPGRHAAARRSGPIRHVRAGRGRRRVTEGRRRFDGAAHSATTGR